MKIRADIKPVFKDNILGAGDVYVDEKVVIHDVKLVQAEKDGKTYSFVAFPAKKKGDSWDPIIMIKDKDFREELTAEVRRSLKEQYDLEKEPLDMTVDVRLYEKDETRAYATINYGGLVKIDGIRIFERDGELKISYPYGKNGDRYQNVAGPASPGNRTKMGEAIIKAYEDKKLEKKQTLGEATDAPGDTGPDSSLADTTLPWDKSL